MVEDEPSIGGGGGTGQQESRQEDTQVQIDPSETQNPQITAPRLNSILNRMDPKLIYMLYSRLAIQMKDRLG